MQIEFISVGMSDEDHTKTRDKLNVELEARGFPTVTEPDTAYDPTCVLCEYGEEPGHEH